MPSFNASTVILTVGILLLLACPAHAFGAGNIASVSKIEGSNWRHGDIEDTLLTLLMYRAAGGKKFDKMNVKRTYFGNWLRDYSQAIDVGTVKYVSAEAIRILLWVLGFMTFGYGTKEFEVTAERLGCYRPEDHIDNPKDYADNIDATQYDTRLRGPVDERVELAIDPQTGMKNYIANERAGCMTSAQHVRKLFSRCIQLGRSYGRSRNEDELFESLRLLGTGLHCLEDFSAHSNYTELALIEMGVRDVFPHVGRRTAIRLQGAQNQVYPLITGTFGGVDFLHSVMGEFDDKATQSEIAELEGTMQNGSQADTSMLKELLSSIPSGIFGGKDQVGKADALQENATVAQMNQMRVSPRQPEEFTRQMQQVSREIYPIIQWHDEIMLSITEAIEKIPVLPDLIEKLEEQLNIFVFSLLAPFVVPLIDQIKTELNEGSSEIIQSSKDKQLIVFNEDGCSDPTHSMLSKDHFSNILNEPAGKIASQVLKWVVPQIMQAIDDQNVDPERTINRIIHGVFHHPAQRSMGDDGASEGRRLMFGVVENWWREQSYNQGGLRRQLSRAGVENGENHKEGVQDTGHGCGKPLGMAKSGRNTALAGAMMGVLQDSISGSQGGSGDYWGGSNSDIGKFASEAAGGGPLGGLVGGIAGALGGSLLYGAFGGDSDEPKTETYGSSGYTQGGGYQQNYSEVGRSGNRYAQAEVTQTQYSGGRQETEFQRYEQSSSGYVGRVEERVQTQPTYGGGYEQTVERTTQRPGYEEETESWKQHKNADSDDSDDERKKKKHHKKHSGGRGEGYGEKRREFGGGNEYGGGREEYGGSSGYGEQRQEYGGRDRFGGREDSGRGGNQYAGGREEYGGGYAQEERWEEGRFGGGFGGDRRNEDEVRFGGREGGGFGGGFGQERREEGGFGGGYEEERREEGGWGGGREREEQQEEYGELRRNNDEYGERREGGGGWGF